MASCQLFYQKIRHTRNLKKLKIAILGVGFVTIYGSTSNDNI